MPVAAQIIYVGETEVGPLLRRIAPMFDCAAIEQRMAAASDAFPAGWPVGYERWLLKRGLPRIDPPVVALRSPIARAIRFEDGGSVDHLVARPPSELAA